MSNTASIRGYHVMNRAWYATADAQPEIMIGLYNPSGGCRGEFAIRWHDLGPHQRSVPRLEIFNDAWSMFFGLPEVADLAGLPKSQRTQDGIIAFLRERGFADLTSYNRPEVRT